MKRILLILAVLFTGQLYAADYYWVGGGGSWSDLNHWRLDSSGGAIPSIVPSSADNVFFDANSGFTPASRNILIGSNVFCNNMTWGAVANSPFILGSATQICWLAEKNIPCLPVGGSLLLMGSFRYRNHCLRAGWLYTHPFHSPGYADRPL